MQTKLSSSSLAQTSGKRHRKHLETPSIRQVSSHTDVNTDTACIFIGTRQWTSAACTEKMNACGHVGVWRKSTRVGHTRDCVCAYTWLEDGHFCLTDMHANVLFRESMWTQWHWKKEYLSAYPEHCFCLNAVTDTHCSAFRRQHQFPPQESLTPELAYHEKVRVTQNWSLSVCLNELHLTNGNLNEMKYTWKKKKNWSTLAVKYILLVNVALAWHHVNGPHQNRPELWLLHTINDWGGKVLLLAARFCFMLTCYME